MTDKEKISRRSFLNKLWIGLGAVAAVEAVALVATWFKPRRPRSAPAEQGELIVAGPVGNFERGSVTAFVRGKFYLARLDNGGFLALSRTCTHLGCTVPWVADESRFVCPCHASMFDINGDVLEPPAPRAMDLFEVRIENDIVSVNTGRRTKRMAFEPEQATYPRQA
jgi:cytochrome b6-f complex iron-sulfur subunit